MNRFLISAIWLLAILISGCQPVESDDAYWRGRGWAVCACAHAIIVEGTQPTVECETCDGDGWLPIRDTGRYRDCPDCETDKPKPSFAAVEPPRVACRHTDYGAAHAQARELGRPLIVYLTIQGCAPCKRFESQVISSEAFGEWVDATAVLSVHDWNEPAATASVTLTSEVFASLFEDVEFPAVLVFNGRDQLVATLTPTGPNDPVFSDPFEFLKAVEAAL